MTHPNVKLQEKIMDLPGTSLSIWKVHPDALREQDKNARIMDDKTFARLTENIANNKQLESLPFCCISTSPGGSTELQIISGHHRIRAARKANIKMMYVLVEERELSRDQIRSKQLAHNALSGTDDAQILKEIYEEIQTIDAKIESGIFDLEKLLDGDIKIDEIQLDFDYEQILILFLRREYERFESILDEIEGLEDYTKIYLADMEIFQRYKNLIQQVSKKHNVRNIGAIMSKIMDIVEEKIKEKPQKPS